MDPLPAKAGVAENFIATLALGCAERSHGTIGADAVRIMKSQDLSYVRMQRQQDANKIAKMQSSLHFLGADEGKKKKRKHTVFVDSKSKAEDFDVAAHFNTLPELSGRSFNRPRVN
ncbi:MAG: hypothetical protein ACO3R5_07965, partial [Pseudohongiellaceae bacterium]